VVSSTPQPHFTPGKDLVPILQEAGWAPGPVLMGGKSRYHWDSIPDCPARSQSLYQLGYPGHTHTHTHLTHVLTFNTEREKKSKIQLFDNIFLRNIIDSTKEVRILVEVTGIWNFLTESEQKTLEQFVHA